MKECTYCEEARHLAVEITKTVLTIEPATENQKAIYPELVSDTNSLWQCRRARISTATHGVPAIEWFTLIAGGAITVFFTYFFGLESLRLQLIMTAMVVILIALNLVLVLLFGYPFQGDLAITNEAFMQDYKIFNNRY
jgi:ABC-type branched-subunit amino acid transport system permease subunit